MPGIAAKQKNSGQAARARSRPFRVRTVEQLRAVNSAERHGVIEALISLEQTTAGDLAVRLGTSVQAAHYHLRRLEGIGLVREATRLATGGRPSVLYELVSKDIVLDPRRATKAFLEEKIRGAKLFMLRAEREYGAAARAGRGRDEPRVLRVTRDSTRMSSAQLRRLHSLLAEVDTLFRESGEDPSGEAVALTIVLAPKGSK